MKIKITKPEGPGYMVMPYFEAAQKMVEDLAPTAIAEADPKNRSILYISGDDEIEVRQFVGHVMKMSPFFLKEEEIA